jgi:catechol 2,3-dioxygenase-like lactoylglutathione lyase family enzyme
VGDLDRARGFYESGLGWERSTNDEGIVFYQVNGSVVALFPRSALAADANLPEEGEGFPGFTLAYCARSRTEVDEVLALAEEAGARILKPAADAFWGGYSGYFADPDGFAWEVAWNPAWTLTPEGDVRLTRK